MSSRSRTLALGLLPVLLGGLGSALIVSPAHAEVPPSVKYSLSSHTKTTDVTDYSHRLGVCYAKSNGVHCSISKGRTATRTIGTTSGVSTKFVAAQLNISSSTSVTVTVGCNTVTLKKGQRLEAYPVGSRHRYKIHKQTRYAGGGVANEYTGYKYTYNPYQTGIACKIR